ncbi:FxLYD domain-containing protein [Hominifimenecus sp. rT4P-3]|uniref:FxLYD domain-containing protein n=1 Tax=Hominifimenecus sp. rT4P-3 TaxID=3242979 RepID=UPI003DA226E3
MKTEKKIIDINAHIINIVCEIDVDNDVSKALISFDNLGFGVITAVKFNAKGFNSFGDVVQIAGKDKFYLIIQDISVDKNTSVQNLKAKIPNSDIRRLELEECQICYADGSITSYAGADNREFEVEEFETDGTEKETLEAIRDVVSAEAKNLPQDFDFGWLCSCGRYNTNDLGSCSNCEVKKSDIFKITDLTYISDVIAEHHKNREEREERAKQEAKEKEKAEKSRNIKIGIGVVVTIILTIFIGRAVVLAGRTTYSSEAEMKSALQGRYTYYDDSGRASRQIVIDGDTAIYKWSYSDSADMKTSIEKWDYKNGKIHTFEDLIVTNKGYLKDGSDIYEKGGYMSTSSSFYSSSYNSKSDYSVLKITADGVTSNSGYTICTGSVKNNGTKTYKFVQVKGSFKDLSGNVIDTDWTYAVGSEGLEPGESTSFRLSVTKNSKITSCSVSLLDYN